MISATFLQKVTKAPNGIIKHFRKYSRGRDILVRKQLPENTAINGRTMVKNLLTQSVEVKRKFLQSFDDILADCGGTVWELERSLDGVASAIANLENHGKQMIYVTNNGMRSDEEYISKFKESGITVNFKNVIHPAIATVEYLKQLNFTGLVYTIGSPAFRKIVQAAGFRTIDGPNEIIDESFSTMWKTIRDNQPVGAVVLDSDVNLSINKLIRAQLYLQNPSCLFIVGTTEMRFLVDNTTIMGPGPFYKAIEQAIGRKAVVLGKPGQELAEIIVKKYKIRDRKRVLVIGDMLEQDMGFASAAGFRSLTVLTGGCSLDSLQTHRQIDELPDYYLNSLADFSHILDEVNAAQS